MVSEVKTKLDNVRSILAAKNLAAIRLRGVDWWSYITGGGSDVVLLAAETGPAEVFVTAAGAFVLTDAIEAPRLAAEEVPPALEIFSRPWQEPQKGEAFVKDKVRGGRVASDRPVEKEGEVPLPAELVAAKRRMGKEEIERYRSLAETPPRR